MCTRKCDFKNFVLMTHAWKCTICIFVYIYLYMYIFMQILCTFLYIYLCITYVHVYTYVYLQDVPAYKCITANMYWCTHICTGIHIYVYPIPSLTSARPIHVYSHSYTHANTHSLCTHTHTGAHAYIHLYCTGTELHSITCAYAHTCIDTRTHT